MSKSISAGLLMYRLREGTLEVFLAHPGGPFFAAKDEGAWGIPKGLIDGGEELLAAARREFEEETGIAPSEPYRALGSIRQPSGKVVHAWAFRHDADPPPAIRSNTFELEWPPRSGKRQVFPEIDRAAFFPVEEARLKINQHQRAFIERLEEELAKQSEK
jgi:predicted NUDIX family NTP pyrophosphohydrolase